MITRATDAAFLNKVVNHPSVRPYVYAPEGPLDLTEVVGNPNNLAMTGQHGGFIFVQTVPCVYEIHSQVLPDGRGEWALNAANAAVDRLFCTTNATEVYTRVPSGNVAAAALARACGAKPEHRVVQNLSGKEIAVEIYGARLQDWIRTAPGLIARGKEFHDMLHAKYQALGMQIPEHPQDDWHDRSVGAAVGMFVGGQPIKGCLVFNRWAAMALAPPMQIVSLKPLIVDITDCRLEIRADDFDVIPKQVH